MPFTFAHPAIVLPLPKWLPNYFSLTALIVGSIVPDFEYFFRMKILSEHSHTFAGLFYFDLPVGLILYLLFGTFVRTALVTHLPSSVRERIPLQIASKNLLSVSVSIVAGAATHLFWDSFTHATGFGVQHFSLLQHQLHISNQSFPFFKILQHVSTLIGLSYIVYVVIRQPRIYFDAYEKMSYYWLMAGGIFISILLLKLFTAEVVSFGEMVVTAISAGIISIFIPSIIYYVRFSDKRAF